MKTTYLDCKNEGTFNPLQLAILERAENEGIDITPFANPEISSDNMDVIIDCIDADVLDESMLDPHLSLKEILLMYRLGVCKSEGGTSEDLIREELDFNEEWELMNN